MFVTPARTNWFLILSLSVLTHSSLACSVPVFRYALERWAPDDYQATVFHRGPLTANQASLLRRLREAKTNLNVTVVDLDGNTSSAQRAIWKEQDTTSLPWLYVTYPPSHPVAEELDAGIMDRQRVTALLKSPRRQEIGSGLIEGETAFWVQLDSGNTSADDAAWQTLNQQLDDLADTLKLPTLEQEDIDAGLVSVGQDDLKLSFQTRRIARDSADEEIFVRMLLDTEEDLLDREDPMIFPVFGRGRVLYALVGSGIMAETIKEAAAYVVGACSCQVKAENPGVDLLMTFPWDELVQTSFAKEQPTPELTGLVKPSQAPPPTFETAPTLPEKETASLVLNKSQEPTPKNALTLWITLPALFIVLVLGFGSIILLGKSSS